MNHFLDLSHLPRCIMVRVVQFGRSVAIIQSVGSAGRVRLHSTDISSAYRQVAKQRRDTFKPGVLTHRGPALDLRGQFGDRGMVHKFTRTTNLVVEVIRDSIRSFDLEHASPDPEAVVWLSRRRAAGVAPVMFCRAISCYLDDFMGACWGDSWRSPTGLTRPEAHFDLALDTISGKDRFALPCKAAKLQRPCS